MGRAQAATKRKTTKKAAKKPAKAAPPRGHGGRQDRGERDREAFKREAQRIEDEGPTEPYNEGVLIDLAKLEEQAHAAVGLVTTDAALAQSLADPRALPWFQTGKGEFVTIDYLCLLYNAGAKPGDENPVPIQLENGTDYGKWPPLVNGDGKVTVKLGTAPARGVPVEDLEAWLRGDPKARKPRQVSLGEKGVDEEFISEQSGAKHFIRRRASHHFQSTEGIYEVDMTESQLARFRGNMEAGKRLASLDRKMKLVKEQDVYPGDTKRREEMESLVAIILTDDNAEEE